VNINERRRFHISKILGEPTDRVYKNMGELLEEVTMNID
jgi:hypothetical protein